MSVSINSIENREQVLNLSIARLRENGVKYRKEKEPASKPNKKQDKITYGKIFYIPLQYLDVTEVHLNGIGAVKVPTFVVNSCQRIFDEVSCVGIFRKTGSANRQKEIIVRLERGLPYEESDNVIDIACILKTFFRSLPEALIPPGNIQETLIRCLLNDTTSTDSILLTCLLLPPLVLNTLAYFCQFLTSVARYADTNKMTISNLAIILAPSIMPVHHNIQQRHNSHVKVMQVLIESAAKLGVVPDIILEQLQKLNVNEAALLYTVKKKKKRRSGSLTRMFNGFKKIVGALGSSNESLEKTPDFDKDAPTPCLTKSAKKRRVNDGNPFSARKKKDLLSLLPEGSAAILPNTPAPKVKEGQSSKNSKRISLGARKADAKLSESIPIAMDRRWSLVGAPWHRKKSVDKSEERLHARLSPVVSLPSLSTPERRSFIVEETGAELAKAKSEEIMRESSPQEISFVQVPRSEYEAIKERVSAIETKITQEFEKTTSSDATFTTEPDVLCYGPESVQEKFEKTLEETTPIHSVATTTDQLARRLSRELKIRRSTECRSPSQRKIGTIRRRSRENGAARLSRSTTWHMGTTPATLTGTTTTTTAKTISDKIDSMSKESLCLRSNLKRGRPNTVLTGLRHPPSPTRKGSDESSESMANKSDDEKWIEADKFFNDPHNDAREDDFALTPVLKTIESVFKTPAQPAAAQSATPTARVGRSMERKYVTSISVNESAMAPPPSLPPRRTPNNARKTPVLPPKTPTPLSFAPAHSVPDVQTGRASIARIRSQNAGHVAAKARLFDNLTEAAAAASSSSSSATSGSNNSARNSASVVVAATSNMMSTRNSLSGPKNYNNQHSVPPPHTEEPLLNRVLKESNRTVVPRESPRKSTTPRRRQILRRQKLHLHSPRKTPILSGAGAKKQQMTAKIHFELKRRRLSELCGVKTSSLPSSVSPISAVASITKRTNNIENKTPPTTTKLKPKPLGVRKSPRLHMRR